MVEMKAAHSMSVFGVSSFVAILFIWGVWIDMSSCSYVLWFVYSRATPRYSLLKRLDNSWPTRHFDRLIGKA